MLVGRVDEHGLAGLLAAHDEHVVLERPDDELVDPDLVVARSAAGRTRPTITASPGSSSSDLHVRLDRAGLVEQPSRSHPVSTDPGGMPVNFAFSEEQEELRDTVRRFLEAKSPEAEVRRLMETDRGLRPAVWSQMGEQLGLQGLTIPEEYGGQGFTLVELGVVLEEMGRALLCAPYFSTVVLGRQRAPQRRRRRPASRSCSRASRSARRSRRSRSPSPTGKWDEAGITMEATRSGDAWTLDGTKMFVLDGHTADLIVVVAAPRTSAPAASRSSRSTATPRVSPARRSSTMDQTRKQAKLEFDTRPARAARRRRATGGPCCRARRSTRPRSASPPRWSAARRRCSTCRSSTRRSACSSAGRSARSRRSSTSAPTCCSRSSRRKSAAYYAGVGRGRGQRRAARRSASLAKAYCSDAYFHAAAENIQIHGGIGFTWEHPAHLYFKRAKCSEMLLRRPDLPPRAARAAHRHLTTSSILHRRRVAA